MGISDFGEMTRLARMAKPTVCVLTNIGLCHLENLKTRDGILKAKTEMFAEAMPGAAVIVNGDDDKLITLKDRTPRPVFFGLEPSRDLYAEHIENLGLSGTRCDFVTKARTLQRSDSHSRPPHGLQRSCRYCRGSGLRSYP